MVRGRGRRESAGRSAGPHDASGGGGVARRVHGVSIENAHDVRGAHLVLKPLVQLMDVLVEFAQARNDVEYASG